MDWNAVFFLQSMLLGVGLAMDAFSVSLANGLNEPHMKKLRKYPITKVLLGTFPIVKNKKITLTGIRIA